MESSNFIMALVTTFIGVAILLSIGIQVLGNVQTSTNCSTLPGNTGAGTLTNSTSGATGWALSCLNANTSIQGGYSLLLVIVIVIAAVAILAVVRLL